MTAPRRLRLFDTLETIAGLAMMLWALAQVSFALAVGVAGGFLFVFGLWGRRAT